MKRLFPMSILLSFLAVSCMVSDMNEQHTRYDRLDDIARDLVDMSSTFAMSTLCGLAEESVYIDAEGFRHQCVRELETRPRINYDFVRTGERLWEVTASGKTLNFTLRISLNSDDPRNGVWTVSPFTLYYDEGFGYSAVMSALDDIVLHYDYIPPHFLSPGTWELDQDGIYEMHALIDGKEAGSCILEY